MRTRNYEKRKILTTLILLLILVESITSIFFFSIKKFTYKKLTGTIVKDNLINVIASRDARKSIYKNNQLYLNDKIINYSIEEDRGLILTKNNIKYYEVIISTKKRLNEGINETVDITLRDKKKSIIELAKKIWVGDER